MNINLHDHYQLLNTSGGQRTNFKATDLYQYWGQVIVYGVKLPSGIHVPHTHGRVNVPEGPACFPLFLGEPADRVVRLIRQLNSLPLCLVLQDGSRLPVLSLEQSHMILGGQRYVREDMIKRAQKLIELYRNWWEAGEVLPGTFRLKQQLVRSAN